MYLLLEDKENLRLPQRVYVFCADLEKKQRLFPYIALNDWFL